MNKFYLAAGSLALLAQPALAQDGNARDGIRFEVRAAYETPTVSSVVQNNDVYKLGSAFGIGGEIGFDLAVTDSLVVGPYGQYTLSSVENCDGTFCVSSDSYIEGGIHLGYALGENGQVFGKLGYGELSLETTNPATSDKGKGAAFALGYEHGFGEMLYGRIEFGYADVGEIYTLNFQRRHATAAVGVRF